MPSRERPILFSGPMVRAILEGRKTQTRRIVKPPFEMIGNGYLVRPDGHGGRFGPYPCPYGQPGDRLWVRETWSHTGTGVWSIRDCSMANDGDYIYRADGEIQGCKWWPSIHMPRWVSRIHLEVVSVRVQRLQDISEEDAMAEGLSCLSKDGGRTYKYGIPDRDGLPGSDDDGRHWSDWNTDPRIAFRTLWDSINADRGHGWETNPWVWVVEFKKVAA